MASSNIDVKARRKHEAEMCLQEHKDERKQKNKEYYTNNADDIKQNQKRFRAGHKDDKKQDDKKQQKRRHDQFNQRRKEEFENRKGNFQTKVPDIPCDTTQYELASTPETGIMNWYQCVGKWRLQWPMEDIQDLMDCKGASETKQAQNREDTKVLLNKLKVRINNEKVTPEKQNTAADNFFRAIGRGCPWGKKHQYHDQSIDALLLCCASCGMKDYDDIDEFEIKRNFVFLPLKELGLLKLNPVDYNIRKNQMAQDPLFLPINDDGDLEAFYPWKVRSIYPLSSEDSCYYHLHPEFVRCDSEIIGGQPGAFLCPDCADCIKKGNIPANSITDAVDFGLGSRIGLTNPSVRELHIIAYVRYYYNIIKIESNSRRLREHQQSAIKGSSILFEQDAPQVVSNLLSLESMNSNVFLHFVGHKGEFDALYKKTMQSKTADVFGRSWVIYQWLSVLHVINPIYQNLQLPSFFVLKDMMDSATKQFLSQSLNTFDDKTMDTTDQMKDDIAGVRATTNAAMQASHEPDNRDDTNLDVGTEFALKHCLLTNSNKTAHNSSTDSTQAYLLNAAKAIGANVDIDKEEYDKAKSFRSQYPINEFTDGEHGLVAAFPHIFMFGKAYKKDVSNLSRKDCIHLLMQFSSVPASCQMLIFYLFDIQRRHDNIRGVSARRKSDPKAFDKLSKEFTSAEFQVKVQNAVAHPSSKDAKYVLKKLLPVLTTAGKNTCFGALERNSSLGETYALIRRFGPQFLFLTIAIDDVNNPQVFRLTFNQRDNVNFPSVASGDFLSALEHDKPFAIGNVKIPTNWSALATAVTNNPVASAFIYKRLIYNIVTILIGLKPSRLFDTRSKRKISPRFTASSETDEGGVIAGHVDAYNGVHEASGRGGLHAHLMLWAAICADLLQGVADMKEICDIVSETLDSMFCATLPREYHVKDLIEKELLFYPTKTNSFNKTIRRGRAMLIPPNPLNEEEFDDFVHTSICSFGIHSHDKFVTGRCHKPPKGITRCALTKPSGLIDRTKPVQLIDTTPLQTKPSEKVTISYIVSEQIQDRKSAIDSIPAKNRVGPTFRENDPRLIVYEPKRPPLEPLPRQTDNATKQWIILKLLHAMTPNKNEDTYNILPDCTLENKTPMSQTNTKEIKSITEFCMPRTTKLLPTTNIKPKLISF